MQKRGKSPKTLDPPPSCCAARLGHLSFPKGPFQVSAHTDVCDPHAKTRKRYIRGTTGQTTRTCNDWDQHRLSSVSAPCFVCCCVLPAKPPFSYFSFSPSHSSKLPDHHHNLLPCLLALFLSPNQNDFVKGTSSSFLLLNPGHLRFGPLAFGRASFCYYYQPTFSRSLRIFSCTPLSSPGHFSLLLLAGPRHQAPVPRDVPNRQALPNRHLFSLGRRTEEPSERDVIVYNKHHAFPLGSPLRQRRHGSGRGPQRRQRLGLRARQHERDGR